MKQYNLRLASSTEDINAVRSIRQQVFIDEQGVDESLEWTDQDADYIYVLAQDEDQAPIGTGRVLVQSDVATIGRMAVLPHWRSLGIGSAILSRLIEIAKTYEAETFVLSAQVQAIGFYQSHDFVASGEVYLDAGIEHRKMTR
jgi:predicted GNAT family N-acyltransferase